MVEVATISEEVPLQLVINKTTPMAQQITIATRIKTKTHGFTSFGTIQDPSLKGLK